MIAGDFLVKCWRWKKNYHHPSAVSPEAKEKVFFLMMMSRSFMSQNVAKLCEMKKYTTQHNADIIITEKVFLRRSSLVDWRRLIY